MMHSCSSLSALSCRVNSQLGRFLLGAKTHGVLVQEDFKVHAKHRLFNMQAWGPDGIALYCTTSSPIIDKLS